jgi:hypothetical protein
MAQDDRGECLTRHGVYAPPLPANCECCVPKAYSRAKEICVPLIWPLYNLPVPVLRNSPENWFPDAVLISKSPLHKALQCAVHFHLPVRFSAAKPGSPERRLTLSAGGD